jgi:ELWxxDGT repeat protein
MRAARIGREVYFAASNLEFGYELWKTDGTEAGTELVKDIAPGSAGSGPNYMTPVRSRRHALAGDHIARVDSTDTAAANLHDKRPAARVFVFNAGDAAHGREIWRSDGTEAGTFLVQDIVPGPANSSPIALTPVRGFVFFSTIENRPDGLVNASLWMTDGTTEGTVKIVDAPAPSNGYALTQLAAADSGERPPVKSSANPLAVAAAVAAVVVESRLRNAVPSAPRHQTLRPTNANAFARWRRLTAAARPSAQARSSGDKSTT